MRLILSILLLTGCVTTYGPPDAQPRPDRTAALKAWQAVLSSHVDDLGRINFATAANDPNLMTYVSYISVENPLTVPEKFPRPEDKLAEYINSYNALALYGVIRSGEKEGFLNGISRAKFFAFTEYVIGGREVSLYDLENNTIRKLGEPRIHFALNCMSIGCPRLPREPFVASNLESQLQAAAIEFFNSTTYVQVDSTKKIARLSEILDFFTEDFAKDKQGLISFVNKYRRDQIPNDYSVEFIPYNWRLNWQPQ